MRAATETVLRKSRIVSAALSVFFLLLLSRLMVTEAPRVYGDISSGVIIGFDHGMVRGNTAVYPVIKFQGAGGKEIIFSNRSSDVDGPKQVANSNPLNIGDSIPVLKMGTHCLGLVRDEAKVMRLDAAVSGSLFMLCFAVFFASSWLLEKTVEEPTAPAQRRYPQEIKRPKKNHGSSLQH